MIVKQELLNKLKSDFMLNIYEVRLWTVLLSRGIATAGELADISGVPRSRCYDVLESLEKKGFIIMKLGKPIRYIAVPPEEIVERVKKSIKEDANLSTKMIEDIKKTDIFRELELLHKTGIEKVDGDKLSDFIVGRANIYQFLKQMVSKAKESVLIVTTETGFKRKIKLLSKILRKLKRNKVKIKIFAPIREKLDERIINLADIRNRDINARLVIVDNRELLFMITEDNLPNEDDSAVWIDSGFFVKAVRNLFSLN